MFSMEEVETLKDIINQKIKTTSNELEIVTNRIRDQKITDDIRNTLNMYQEIFQKLTSMASISNNQDTISSRSKYTRIDSIVQTLESVQKPISKELLHLFLELDSKEITDEEKLEIKGLITILQDVIYMLDNMTTVIFREFVYSPDV
jgi:hypothetical protein